jgi:hypothetical protein
VMMSRAPGETAVALGLLTSRARTQQGYSRELITAGGGTPDAGTSADRCGR